MPMSKRWVTRAPAGIVPVNSSNQNADNVFSEAETAHGANLTPCTVTRIIGSISWFGSAESTPSPGTGFDVAAGLVVVRREIVSKAAGDSSIPDPLDPQQEVSWLWKWKARLYSSADHPASAQYPLLGDSVWGIDVRAQRKMRADETLALCINSDAGSVHETIYSLYLRALTLS